MKRYIILRLSSGLNLETSAIVKALQVNWLYELGVKIRLEVEDAELNLQQARGNLSRAWRDHRAAQVNLLWVMGVQGESIY